MMALLAQMGLRFGGQDDLFSFECVKLRGPAGNPSGVFRKLLHIQMGCSGAMSTWSCRLGGISLWRTIEGLARRKHPVRKAVSQGQKPKFRGQADNVLDKVEPLFIYS